MKIFCWPLVCCFLLIASMLSAEEPNPHFMQDLMTYLDLKIPENDITKLSEMKVHAESSGLTNEERKTVYKELFDAMAQLQGAHPPAAVVDSMVQSAMSWNCPGEAAQISKTTAKPGELAGVIKRGSGKIPLILIPDVGYDGSAFEPFLQRNGSNYTMYSVTLPGFASTPVIPGFEHRDYSQTRLWKNAEQAVLNLIHREKLRKVVLAGHQGGGYLAMRIALDHPESIASVIVLNGLLYAPLTTSTNPSGKLNAEDRKHITKLFLPIELFPRPSRQCYSRYLQSFATMLCKNPDRSKALTENIARSDAHIVWDYYAELFATDLTEEIQKIKVPLLVIPSIPDPDLPNSAMMFPGMSQWKQLNFPLLKVVPFENTRWFATEDNPEKLDKTILAFLKS